MKITSIPQIYRHLGRWTEILTVLSKYELAAWIARLGPEFAKDILKARCGDVIARQRWETRVRLALIELGPTFIKLGQILSTRPDLVGVELAEELQDLQANVPADSGDVVRKTIETELGHPVEELYAAFDDRPLAAASIGQVHQARLHSGEAVVVKVQRTDIARKVEVDLEILAGLALLAERIPEFRNYRPQATVAEFRRVLSRELDFRRERRTMQQFARNFANDPSLHIPRTFARLSTSRVLTMELVEGIPLNEINRLAETDVDKEEIARRGARLYLEMIFTHGFYHADPHPGNIRLLAGNVIGLLDFGMVGRIDQRLREDIEEALLAAVSQDAEHLTGVITRVGAVPRELDRAGLGLDLADFVSHYANQPVDEFDLSGALKEMTEIIRRYRIMLPARIGMLIKVLVTLEGTSRLVSPKFNLAEVMAPYEKQMRWKLMSPGRRLQRLWRLASEIQRFLEILPQGMIDILEQVQSGKFDVHLDHRGLEPSVNRLVLGMLASALFLGSSLLLSRSVPPRVGDISVFGAAGCLVGVALGLRLWRAIGRSMEKKRDEGRGGRD